MKEIIIRTSEIFANDTSTHWRYDDEDISTLGAKQVFEAIVIKDNDVHSTCCLMGNDAIKHIDSPVIIQETTYKPGSQTINYREASLQEIEASINVLEKKSHQFNGGTSKYIEDLRNVLTQLKRDNTLDKLI